MGMTLGSPDDARLLDRREWLELGALGLSGLTLPHLLGSGAKTRLARSAKSCVLFLLQGAPGQLDTWDLKPDAPAEVRGEFRSIATSATGMRICEHLPRLSRVARLFTLVRSMTHRAVFHNAAMYQALTGWAPTRDTTALNIAENDHPHPGAILSLKRPAPRHLPTAVSLPNVIEEALHPIPGQGAGFLGVRHSPLCVESDPGRDNFSVAGLSAATSARRLANRRALLRSLDRSKKGTRSVPSAAGMTACQQRAFDLLKSPSARQAFDLTREPARLRDRYGRHKAGQSMLLARRLVEAGVRLVTVYWGGRLNKPLPYWDTHVNLFPRMKNELLPPFDQALAAFLEDLDTRGLLSSTLVVCMGEFGRTPRIGQFTGNGADPTGRDHWAHCYSLLVAGGNLGGGRVLGRSDRRASYPVDDSYTPQDITATLLTLLGVNPRDKVLDNLGRFVPLSDGRFRASLFGT